MCSPNHPRLMDKVQEAHKYGASICFDLERGKPEYSETSLRSTREINCKNSYTHMKLET